MTVHSMPSPSAPGERRTASGRAQMLLILAVCAAPVVASYAAYFLVRPQSRSNYADLIQPTRSLPASLDLRSLDGTRIGAAGLKGQWLLVVVAGGACDGECERHLHFQRQLVEMTGAERGRIDKVWLVDDDAPLRAPVQAAVASGTPVQVLRVPAAALAGWLSAEPGRALADHLYLVDPMGEWMMRTPVDPDPSKFKRDLDRLLRASASWDREGR